MKPLLHAVPHPAVDLPYYIPAGNECALFELAWSKRLPLLTEGSDGVRQDPVRRPYGVETRPAAAHRVLP